MSSIVGFGSAGPQRFSRNALRSVTTDGTGTLRYPSPFFDIAHTYLPSSFRSMLKWCRYYFISNPLINAVCYKMAEYPVTDLVFDTDNKNLKDRWGKFFGKGLQFKRFEVEAGLDFNCYGNCLISIFFPFIKYLKCRHCGHSERVDRVKYTFRDFKFCGSCKSCGRYGDFDVFDHHIRSWDGIRLIRWNPEQISIQHNEATGEDLYYYSIPGTLANDVKMAKRHTIEKIPQIFIEALRKNKSLLFDSRNLFHMKRATIAQKDKGWGLPMILPVLKDTFYLQILRKAQECVGLETPIETNQGLVCADDVRVGDIVRTHTGAFRRVEEKWYRDARADEIGVRITPTGLRAFPSVYSPKHPIFTIRRNNENLRSDTKDRQRSSVILRNPDLYEEVLCPAGQFQVGDYVLYPRGLPEQLQEIDVVGYTGLTATGNFVYSGCGPETAEAFETLEDGGEVAHDNPGRVAKRAMREDREPKRLPVSIPLDEDFAYILGWYAGDGSCGARHVEFTIGQSDPRTYDGRLKEAIRSVFGVECTGTETDSIRHLTACCVIMEKLFRGLMPGTAKHKRVPVEVLESPPPIKLAFLRGLFEADGHFGNKSTLNITSKNLSYDTYRILVSLGCIATISKRKRKPSVIDGRIIKGGVAFPLEVSSASRDRLMSLWESGTGPEVVSGKSGFFWKDYFAARICAVEETEEGAFIDFKIAEDTTFCAAGTATKNSIAIEHIVPLRVLFPQTATGTSDVYSTINLQDWKTKVEQEILRWRLDNNYIPILPLPIGQQTLGGEGRALMLSQEYRVWAEHIVAGMGVPSEFVFGGLCLMLDTLIPTSEGLVPLGEFTPSGDRTVELVAQEGVDVQAIDQRRRIEATHNRGLRQPYTVRTHSGHKLSGAGTHPVCVLKPDLSFDYVTLEDLQPGDYVVRKVGSDLWASKSCRLPQYEQPPRNGHRSRRDDLVFPKEMSGSLARVLGYLVAEGCIDEERVRFGNSNSEVFEDYLRCFNSAFGCALKSTGSRSLESGKEFYELEVWSRDLSAFMKSIGFWGLSKDMRIAWSILRSRRSHVLDFLQTYYEGDGGLNTKPDGTGCIRATTVSPRLAQELQIVLDNLGFDSSIYPPTEASSCHKVVLRSQVRRFEKLVGFVSSTKKAVLAGLPEQGGHIQIPYVKEAVRELKKAHPRESWERRPVEPELTCDVYSPRMAAYAVGRQDHTFIYAAISSGDLVAGRRGKHWAILKEDLLRFCKIGLPHRAKNAWPRFYKKQVTLQALRNADLGAVEECAPEVHARMRRIIEGDLRFDLVEEVIAEDDLVPMGDLSVEGEHCYVAGGIVCHNSYSGSNVSMRILENHFLDHKADHTALVDWIMERVGAYMGWETITHHFKRFKMADDLQRSAYNLQLNQAGKLSDRSLLEETDWDSEIEAERIATEQKKAFENQRRQALSQAEIQGEAQMTMQKYQLRAQKLVEQLAMPPQTGDPAEAGMPPMPTGMPPMLSPGAQGQMLTQQQGMMNQSGQTAAMTPPVMPNQPGGAQQGQFPQQAQSYLNADQNLGATQDQAMNTMPVALMDIARRVAAHLDQMADAEKQVHIMELRNNNPQIYSLVAPLLQQRTGAHKPSTGLPQPEQRAPRRGAEAVTI